MRLAIGLGSFLWAMTFNVGVAQAAAVERDFFVRCDHKHGVYEIRKLMYRGTRRWHISLRSSKTKYRWLRIPFFLFSENQGHIRVFGIGADVNYTSPLGGVQVVLKSHPEAQLSIAVYPDEEQNDFENYRPPIDEHFLPLNTKDMLSKGLSCQIYVDTNKTQAALKKLDQLIKKTTAELKGPEKWDDLPWLQKKLAHSVLLAQTVEKEIDRLTTFGFPETRATFILMVDRYIDIKQANVRTLDKILRSHDWVGLQPFGREASENAWRIAQMASHNGPFQKKALARIQSQLATKNAPPQHMAHLSDRIAVNESRPQKYGTQGRCIGPLKWEPYRLLDKSKVNEWRKEVDLPPLEEAQEKRNQQCRRP